MNGDSAGKSCQKRVQNWKDKKKIRRKNYKYLKQFCFVHQLDACHCKKMLCKASVGTPAPARAPAGGFLLQKQEPPQARGALPPVSAGPPSILVPSGTASGSVSAPSTTCEGIPSPLGFSYDAKESPAAPGASLSSLCTSLWRGQERDFLMHIQTKIPLFALHFFFFPSLKKSQKAQPT